MFPFETGIFIPSKIFPSYKCKAEGAKFRNFLNDWFFNLACFPFMLTKQTYRHGPCSYDNVKFVLQKRFYMIPMKRASSYLESIFSREINFGLFVFGANARSGPGLPHSRGF